MTKRNAGSLAERLDRKTVKDPNSGCWLWIGSLDSGGYGHIKSGGARSISKTIKTHRATYEQYVGPIPDGLDVLHKCDVRCCRNPSHLFVGTHKDNMQDMTAKGRGRYPRLKGSTNPSAKLTEVQAVEILNANGKMRAIGRKYGVSAATVCMIKSGTNWAHLQS